MFAYWNLRYQRGSANFTINELIKYFSTYFKYPFSLGTDALQWSLLDFCKDYLSVDANMFVFCALSCKHLRLLYFWNRMDEKSRQLVLKYGFNESRPHGKTYWSRCLLESLVFILKNVPSDILDWFINKIHKRRLVPYGLFDSPWFDLSPEIYNTLKTRRIREDYIHYKGLIIDSFSERLSSL